MHEYKWLIAIMAAGIALAVIAELVQRRRERKRQEAEARELKQANERYAMDAAKRESLWQAKLIARRERDNIRFGMKSSINTMSAKAFPSTAPTARATVLKMRRDEATAPNSSTIADALLMQSLLTTPSSRYLDGGSEPETTASTHGLMRGQFAIGSGGVSDDLMRSDSSSSSSSDSGGSGGGGD